MRVNGTRFPAFHPRYQITAQLGAGAQGLVFKALDNDLNRAVALKVLRRGVVTSSAEHLIAEAHNVSQLTHPNIVTLLDFGIIRGNPFLVFEFVDGVTLKEELVARGALGVKRSVILMSQIMAAVSSAHGSGIVHRDLSPSNIMIGAGDIPKVMDFGLAGRTDAVSSDDEELMGSLLYMAPEPFHRRPVGPLADVFSLGAIFYEMLVGEHQLSGATQEEIIDDILTGQPRLPSAIAGDVAPILDEIVGRALQRAPEARYASVREMKARLDEYRIPRDTEKEHADSMSVRFLLRRLQRDRGFSALSNSISEVLKLTSESSKASASALGNVLAKDVTVMQRVLTHANSAVFGTSRVTTLSQAIVRIGTHRVRDCATRALVESTFSDGSARLKDTLISSFFSAILAKELLALLEQRGFENAFTAASFHQLGRMLVVHYLPIEYEEIENDVASGREPLDVERAVLGLPCFEIGIAVGRHWRFSEALLEGMRPLPRGGFSGAGLSDQSRGLLGAFTNAVADVLGGSCDVVVPRLDELCDRIAPLYAIDFQTLAVAVEHTTPYATNYAHMLGIREARDSEFLARLVERGEGCVNHELECV